MEFQTIERMDAAELALRHAHCREFLQRFAPQAEGLLVFSRVNIYYLTGTLANGLFWLPLDGEPVLLSRRGLERAKLESPLEHILSFRSYSDIPGLVKDAGSPLGKVLAADMGGLSWSLANLLQAKLPDHEFVPGDQVLARSRARKTE